MQITPWYRFKNTKADSALDNINFILVTSSVGIRIVNRGVNFFVLFVKD